MRAVSFLSALGVLSSLAASAAAQDTPQNWQACFGSKPTYSLTQQVAGCTAAINAGTATPANLATAFNNRGVTYAAQKDYVRAIADYDQAIRLEPHEAVFFENRGLAELKLKRLQSAFADYNTAIRLDGKSAYGYYGRGVTALRLGRTAEGKADIALAKRLDASVAKDFPTFPSHHRK